GQGRVLKPDQFPDRGYYYRSDQFSFAKIGVPALFFSDGTDFIGRSAGWGRQQIEEWELKKYHQPADKLDDSWNFDGMIQDAQLARQSTKSYVGSAGNPAFNEAIERLVLGDEHEARLTARVRTVQAPGGCGALRLGAELIRIASPDSLVHVSTPTWANHSPLL